MDYKYFSQLSPRDTLYIASIGQNICIGKVGSVKVVNIRKINDLEYKIICSDSIVFNVPINTSTKKPIHKINYGAQVVYVNKSDLISDLIIERNSYNAFYENMISNLENL